MKSDINDLCEAFLAALTNAGYAVKSIENYKQVSNRFKKFCAENGYDTYTVNIGQIFADNVFNEETGAFVGYRNVMYHHPDMQGAILYSQQGLSTSGH